MTKGENNLLSFGSNVLTSIEWIMTTALFKLVLTSATRCWMKDVPVDRIDCCSSALLRRTGTTEFVRVVFNFWSEKTVYEVAHWLQ